MRVFDYAPKRPQAPYRRVASSTACVILARTYSRCLVINGTLIASYYLTNSSYRFYQHECNYRLLIYHFAYITFYHVHQSTIYQVANRPSFSTTNPISQSPHNRLAKSPYVLRAFRTPLPISSHLAPCVRQIPYYRHRIQYNCIVRRFSSLQRRFLPGAF